MEKEQKKLLLVAVSVGVFLLVTITVALVILTPKTQMPAADYYSSVQFQPAGTVQPVENLNSVPNVSQPVINNTQETNINFGFEDAETVAAVDSTDKNQLTIQITRPVSAAVPDIEKDVSSPAVSAAPKPAAEPAKPAAVRTVPAASARPAGSTAVAQTPARAAAASKTINDYWIQTGAFAQKFRADDAKEELASKGFVSIIENREVNGQTLYRVRLGPYTSENEANYWLALVKSINGFNESQVRQTVRQQ